MLWAGLCSKGLGPLLGPLTLFRSLEHGILMATQIFWYIFVKCRRLNCHLFTDHRKSTNGLSTMMQLTPRQWRKPRELMIYIYTGMAWETCSQTPQLHRPRYMSYKKSKLVLLSSNLCSRGESPSLSATARNCWKLRVLRICCFRTQEVSDHTCGNIMLMSNTPICFQFPSTKHFPCFFILEIFFSKCFVVVLMTS